MIDLAATGAYLAPIAKAKPMLLYADSLTKVAWQALAAVWYRESNCRMINNPFQFDPIPPNALLEWLLKGYSDCDPNQTAEVISKGLSDFRSAAVLAACFLKHECHYVLGTYPFPAYDIYADAFYGYNGRAYGDNPLNSPYVANQLDDHHTNMSFRGTINGKWIDIIDHRPGALTVYEQLVAAKV